MTAGTGHQAVPNPAVMQATRIVVPWCESATTSSREVCSPLPEPDSVRQRNTQHIPNSDTTIDLVTIAAGEGESVVRLTSPRAAHG